MNFDEKKFFSYLSNQEFIAEFQYFDEIDSTNTYLMNQSEIKDRILVLAEFQRRGKGRLNRKWLANAYDNLTFSIGLKPNLLSNELPYLNFCASLSIANAVEELTQTSVETKWPNDLMLGGKKFCGILIESQFEENRIARSVIGIGINVNQSLFQDEFKNRTTSLKLHFGKIFGRELLLAKVIDKFAVNYWQIKESMDMIISEWKRRCKTLGEKISLTNGKEIHTGIFEDVTNQGLLVLNQNGEKFFLNSGDVTVIKE